MAENKLTSIIGFINQNSITLFWDKAKAPITYAFPAGSVADLEVRKAETLASGFKDFLDQAKLPPSQICLIILPDLVFEKEFPVKDAESAKEEIETFVKTVPFEHVAHRVYSVGKGCKVMAINRELYEILQSVLESQENAVIAVTPLPPLMEYFRGGINASSVHKLLSKIDLIRTNSFIYQEEATAELEQKGSDPRKNKKLLVLLVIFIVLLLALSFLAYKTMFIQKSPIIPEKINTVIAPPEVPPIQTNEATSSALTAAKIKIEILDATGSTGQAIDIKNQLKQNGFTNIQVQNISEISGAKVIVAFSPSVPTSLREQMAILLLKSYPGISTTETEMSLFDIKITLTKNATSSTSAQTPP